MEFEGLTIENEDDIVRYIREGRSTRPRDPRPWAWVERFAHEGNASKRLVAEALDKIIEADAGDDLRPTPMLSEMYNLASLCDVKSGLQRARQRLLGSFDSWDDGQAKALLNWLIGLKPQALSGSEIGAIAQLGARPECFTAALMLLGDRMPRLGAAFASRNMLAAWTGSQSRAWLLTVYAQYWVRERFAPYRLHMLRPLAEAPEELHSALRTAIAQQAYNDADKAAFSDQLDCAWSTDDPAAPCLESFARSLARCFVTACNNRDVSLARTLLLHRDDGTGVPDAEGMIEYANAVQSKVVAFVGEFEPFDTLGPAGKPEIQANDAMPGIRLLLVPIIVRTGTANREIRITVYQLGNLFKAGLMLAAEDS